MSMGTVNKIVNKAAPAVLGAAVAGGSAAAGLAVPAAQAAAAAVTDAAQIANIAFMTHNTLNGIMMENFGATMEALLKTSKLGAKTLTKAVPDPA